MEVKHSSMDMMASITLDPRILDPLLLTGVIRAEDRVEIARAVVHALCLEPLVRNRVTGRLQLDTYRIAGEVGNQLMRVHTEKPIPISHFLGTNASHLKTVVDCIAEAIERFDALFTMYEAVVGHRAHGREGDAA